ncbi:MAG: hypothetical protein WC241_04585 [Candidatus Paceibacterota bacterium]|jgi:hypothetical protein
MAYRTVDPRINDPNVNPADKNQMAINAGYTGYNDYLNNKGSTQSSGTSSVDQAKQTLVDQYNSLMDEMNKRVKDFETANPFSFDEVLAEASTEERYNPYYDAELKDFTSGIERQRQSAEGEKQLLVDMNRIQAGEEKAALDDAISASEEGYAGAGLFFSGARERATGKAVIAGQNETAKREGQFGYNQEQIGRTLTGLGENQATGERRLGAEKTTNVQTEIERQRAEEQARWQTERAQYVGYPYTSSITGGLNQYMQNAFSSY